MFNKQSEENQKEIEALTKRIECLETRLDKTLKAIDSLIGLGKLNSKTAIENKADILNLYRKVDNAIYSR